jgi:hypothetical protein
MPEPTVKKSISLPASLLAEVMKRAAAEGRSFSNYLARLIALDIERAKPRK